MITPDDFWLVEPQCEAMYAKHLSWGAEEAARSGVAIVAIARNCSKVLWNTLALVDETAKRFAGAKFFCFENDSTDDTAGLLDAFAATRSWAFVEHQTLGRPDVRGFEDERTNALAEYRNRCRDWVEANAADSQYVIVLDLDPDRGFSVDGVINSIGWLCDLGGREYGGLPKPGAMASFSMFRTPEGLAHYDAWAARPLAFWEDRRHVAGMSWFSMFWPPVGGQPFPMNSAFGGLCVYKTAAYLSGRYAGGDCEHVAFHRSLHENGWQLYLNPGSRFVAVWKNGSNADCEREATA